MTDPCLFWARVPDLDYIQTIKRFGQIEPVLVMAGEESKLLVSGYKRILALQALNRKILAMEIPVNDSYSKGLIYLFTNQGQTLNQEKIILALRYFASINNITQDVLKQLGIKPGSKTQQLWQDWLNLPLTWDQLLAKGNIALECSHILQKAGPGDLNAVHPFFACLSWSKNNSINLLTWLAETARMDCVSMAETIKTLELEKILKNDLSPGDKIKKILSIVFQARYPVLSGMKSDLARRLGRISVESEWRIEHQDEFESRDIHISTRIKDRNDLARALEGLERIYNSGILEDWPVNYHA